MRRSFMAMAFTAVAAVAPAWVLADDNTILKLVTDRLQSHVDAGQLRGSKLDIEVDGGVVKVSGTVATPEQKTFALNQAAEACEGMDEVQQVEDHLEVKSSRRSTTKYSSRPVSAAGDEVSVLAQQNRDVQPVSDNQVPPQQVPQVAARPTYAAPAPAALQPVPNTAGPRAFAPSYTAGPAAGAPGYAPAPSGYPAPYRYDTPHMPGYAWPSYAAHPNYAGVQYPRQYSPTAWPYIGPFYPYPQVPLGWRKVTLEWDDGWWMLDFKDRR